MLSSHVGKNEMIFPPYSLDRVKELGDLVPTDFDIVGAGWREVSTSLPPPILLCSIILGEMSKLPSRFWDTSIWIVLERHDNTCSSMAKEGRGFGSFSNGACPRGVGGGNGENWKQKLGDLVPTDFDIVEAD